MADAATARIVVLGNFVVDIIGKPLDRLPERGRLLLLDALETHPGGNGPNTAGALGRLGACPAVLGRVGDDLYGRFLTDSLAAWGVATANVVRDPERTTGVTFVPVDSSGERSFIHHFGANAGVSPADVPWERLPEARHFHLASCFVLPALDGPPAAAVLEEARRRGCTTSLDVCWDRQGCWMQTLSPCLPFVDLALPSEEEGAALTGEHEPGAIARALRAAGCGAAIVKLGDRGCWYSGPDWDGRVPAYRVPVRDTTGAGDCFIAGYLYARDAAWPLQRALRFANACGARSVGSLGAVTGMGPAAAIEAWADDLEVRDDA